MVFIFPCLSLSVVLSFLADWGFTPFFNQRLAADRIYFENLSGNFLLWKLLFALLLLPGIIYCSLIIRYKKMGYPDLCSIDTGIHFPFCFFPICYNCQPMVQGRCLVIHSRQDIDDNRLRHFIVFPIAGGTYEY